MTEQQFIDFIEEKVIPELQSFVSTQSFADSEKGTIVSWGRLNESADGEDLLGQDICHYLTDAPTTNAFRIFFCKSGNQVANNDIPHLTFGLSKGGVMSVGSILKKGGTPEVLNTYSNPDVVEPGHTNGFLANQLRDQH